MSRTCCVLNCDSVSGCGNNTFYKFPTNFDMCMQWIKNTGDQSLWHEFQYEGACAFLERYVCSDHFLEIDFTIFGQRDSGLRRDAVPFTTTVKAEQLDPTDLDPTELDPTDETPLGDYSELPVVTPASVEDPLSFDPSKMHFLEQLNMLHKSKTIVEASEGELHDSLTVKIEVDDENVLIEDGLMKNTLLEPELIIGTDPLYFEVEGPCVKTDAERMALQRQKETPEQRERRLTMMRESMAERRKSENFSETEERRQKSAERAAKKRTNETEEERLIRLEKSRVRAAERRKNMTPEEREIWRLKNRLQTRERRKNEDEVRKLMRRYGNAVRASEKRNRETEEEKMERRYKDALRAAERRKMETPEEKLERLRKDRERVQQKRKILQLTESPEEREARLKKNRSEIYRKRHQHKTPEMLAILKSIHEHMNNAEINKDLVNPENVKSLIHFVKSCHPNIQPDYLESAVGDFLIGEDSHQSENSFSNDESDSQYGGSFISTGDTCQLKSEDCSSSSTMSAQTYPQDREESVVEEIMVEVKQEPPEIYCHQ